MNLKALSLGAVLGFLVAVVPSCGTPTCGPQNCNGCCDSMNKCVPQSASNSNSSCGRGGNVCVDCSASAQTCNTTSFSCEVVGGTGGGSGGGTGGGTMGGGTGGGTTGGGTGGGTTGGGTGGGTTGGGSGGGGGLVTGCSASAQNCANAGESCIYTDQMGSTACFPGACDIVTQNCPNATDKCSYLGLADGGTGRGCVPAGNLTEGQACGAGGQDMCAKGMACVSGACAKFCYTSNNCTAASNGQCVGILQIGGTDERPATCVNIAMCDPLLQNCAASTDACSLTANGPGCIPAGTAAVGAMCGNTGGNCVKGAICLGNATAASCHAFCNRDGGMPTCATGTCGGVTNQMGQVQAFGACQ